MPRDKYTPRMLPKIAKMARKGLFDGQIAMNLGIAYGTFRMWKKTKPELVLILEKNRIPLIKKVENALYKRAIGYETKEIQVETMPGGRKKRKVIHKEIIPDVKAIMSFLTNRAPEDWSISQKVGVEVSGSVKMSDLDFSKMTDEQVALLTKAIEDVYSETDR